jgi:hypothetical protein
MPFLRRKKNKPNSVQAPPIAPVILTEQDQRLNYWRLDGTSKQLVTTEEPADGLVISFSESDVRLLESSASGRAIQQSLAREYGERMRIVNATKTLKAAFATPVGRVQQYRKVKLVSGLLVLNSLLATHGPTLGPKVVGFSLGEGAAPLLILFVLSEDGKINGLQIVPRPDSPQFALRSFCTKHKAIFGNPETIDEKAFLLFSYEEMLSALAACKSYPIESECFGIPESQALRSGVALSAALCVGVSGWAAFQYVQIQRLSTQLAQEKARIVQTNQQIESQTKSHLQRFIELGSIDLAKAISLAQQVYEPAGRVVLEPDRTATKLAVVIPLANPGDREAAIKARTTAEAPTQCVKSNVQSSSTMNEIQVNYVCAQDDHALAALFDSRP